MLGIADPALREAMRAFQDDLRATAHSKGEALRNQ
jgi:hypothetical protein